MNAIAALTALLLFSSSAFAHGLTLTGPVRMSGDRLAHAQVLDGFGCNGGNRSPALRWLRPPANAKSYAITVFDIDAPTGSGWWHWVVYDIPATTDHLEAGAGDAHGNRLPAGARQARNDFGQQAYGGACPPKGDKPHRYIFTLHALDVARLEAPADASPAMIGFLIGQHRIAKASLTALYSR